MAHVDFAYTSCSLNRSVFFQTYFENWKMEKSGKEVKTYILLE